MPSSHLYILLAILSVAVLGMAGYIIWDLYQKPLTFDEDSVTASLPEDTDSDDSAGTSAGDENSTDSTNDAGTTPATTDFSFTVSDDVSGGEAEVSGSYPSELNIQIQGDTSGDGSSYTLVHKDFSLQFTHFYSADTGQFYDVSEVQNDTLGTLLRSHNGLPTNGSDIYYYVLKETSSITEGCTAPIFVNPDEPVLISPPCGPGGLIYDGHIYRIYCRASDKTGLEHCDEIMETVELSGL